MRRTRYCILLDILDAIVDGATITRIVYRANINFKMAQKYIDYLMKNGFVECHEVDNRKYYRKTEKGISFQRRLRELKSIDFE